MTMHAFLYTNMMMIWWSKWTMTEMSSSLSMISQLYVCMWWCTLYDLYDACTQWWCYPMQLMHMTGVKLFSSITLWRDNSAFGGRSREEYLSAGHWLYLQSCTCPCLFSAKTNLTQWPQIHHSRSEIISSTLSLYAGIYNVGHFMTNLGVFSLFKELWKLWAISSLNFGVCPQATTEG